MNCCHSNYTIDDVIKTTNQEVREFLKTYLNWRHKHRTILLKTQTLDNTDNNLIHLTKRCKTIAEDQSQSQYWAIFRPSRQGPEYFTVTYYNGEAGIGHKRIKVLVEGEKFKLTTGGHDYSINEFQGFLKPYKILDPEDSIKDLNYIINEYCT